MIKLSSEVYVSDPCYDKGTWCQLHLKGLLPGNYHVIVDIHETYGRNSVLRITHESMLKGKDSNLRFNYLGEAAVDSGQLGIFDAMSYRNDQYPVLPAKLHKSRKKQDEWVVGEYYKSKDKEGEDWYDRITSYTCNTENSWGTYDAGVVTSSGWGDGFYPVYSALNSDQKIIALEIEFMSEENPEDDEWPEDEETE